jgi:phytoene synthase
LDETVDSVEAAEAGRDVASAKLRAIESQLNRLFAPRTEQGDDDARVSGAAAASPETVALADTIRNTPGMTAAPFLDMITGMRSDLSVDPPGPDADTGAAVSLESSPANQRRGQGQGITEGAAVRFRDWPELRKYCYNVAGTVGVMTLPVMGVAPGYSVEDATPAGIDLGIALQLTNILRDVGEDARRGRLYLPLDAIAAAGLTPEQVMSGEFVCDPRYAALMEGQIQRAEEHFQRAQCGVPMLAPAARLPVLAAAEIYGALLSKVRENRYDNYTVRAYTTTREKLSALPGLAWRAWRTPPRT